MATIPCTTFAELQAAVNTAAGGDIITLPANTTVTGNLNLPNRSGVSSPIIIRTNAADGDLPAAGERVDPSYLPFLATIQSTNTVPIVAAARGAHHFTFIGIHFPPKANGFGNQIDLGGFFASTGVTRADQTTNITFDRCVFRGHPVAGQLRAIHVGCHHFTFINNYCDRYGSQAQQGNILLFQNGAGDHRIENNYLSGSTQPILYGGGGVQARVSAQVVSATLTSARLTTVTDLEVGQRIAFLCEGGTRRRWPKCLTVNTGTGDVTFEPLDVVPDIPGDARWGLCETGIVIARNHIAHDPDVVQDGVLQPTTGVGTAIIAGNFGAGSATYAVQAKASGYTGQEARGAASAQTSPVTIAQDQGVRVTWSAVTHVSTATNGGYYIYRTMGGVITRFTVGNVLTFDDVGTGGTVVTSIPSATTFVGWVGVELKNGIDVHIHSNIIENTYRGSFGGESILIKCANQEGTASFLSTENVLIENNVCRHTFGFATVSGSEAVPFTLDVQPKPIENCTFRNNLCYDSSDANQAANSAPLSRYYCTVVNGAKNVQFIHNTSTHIGTGCFYIEKNERGSIAGLVVRDNMLRANGYLVASNNGFGATGLANATDGAYTFSFNALSNASNTISHVTGNNNQYAAVATWLAEFVDGAGADIDDYALDVGSQFENDASDGTDPGVDIAALNTAVDGVITGDVAGPGTTGPTIVTTNLPSVAPLTAYAETLIASGGTAPYAWTVLSGALPTGVAMQGFGTTVAETAGLLGYWRLDETSGTVAADHLGGPPGAYTGSPTLGSTGSLSDGNKGVTLNGTSQYVLVGNVATLRPSAAVTIEAVIKPNSVTGTQNIAGVGGPSAGYCLRLVGSEARFIVNAGAGPTAVTASVAGISIGQTYHMVGTYDGANVRLYVNGTASTPQALTGAINYGSDVNFVIGQRHGLPAGQFFNGLIEEVAVYNVALSSGTVTAHSSARTAAAGPQLRGRPTTAGTYNFTVRVTDAALATASQALTIVVAAVQSVPVIAPTALPAATQNAAYTATLTATEGAPPYAWAVISGTLPTGLSLNGDTGVISGTPTDSGAFLIDVVVQDSVGTTSAAVSFSITVAAVTPENPEPDRPSSWNGMEFRGFKRDVAPTVSDRVLSGDVWIKVQTGQLPRGFIAQRTGSNVVWNEWPSNDARVRQLAQEEQAGILAKTAYLPTWTGSGGNPAIGNGTIEGLYSQVGKHVTARITITAGSTTTFGSGDWSFGLPLAADVTGAAGGVAVAIDGTTRYLGGLIRPTTTTVQVFVSGGSTLWGPTTPFAMAPGVSITIVVDYWVP